MQLIGMLDSPFVRRVAITMRVLGIGFEHNPLSIFRSYDEFRELHPLVKVPTRCNAEPHCKELAPHWLRWRKWRSASMN